jgi:hypothetical protein
MSVPLRQTDFALIWGGSPPSSSEARPVRTSAAPTPRGAGSKASAAGFTSKPFASSESAALVGSLLRTALISELGALTPCALRWRQSATPAGRAWYVLETSVPITSARALGSLGATLRKLHTPTATGNLHHPSMQKWPSCEGWDLIGNPSLSTPRASDMKAGGHGDTGRMGSARHQLQRAMLPTPRSSDASHGPEMTKVRGEKITGMNLRTVLHPAAHETLPTPTKRDKRMDAWSPAYDKRKSPTMDAVLDGAQTGRAPDKWAYARQIAAMLTEAGLTGPSHTLPITYGWMMGFPPGWLARAFKSAMERGSLLPASRSKRTATR